MILLILCFMLSFNNVIAKESYSGLYIKITDATTAVKNNRQDDAKKLFSEIKEEFKKVKNSDSVQGKKVQELLNKEIEFWQCVVNDTEPHTIKKYGG